MAEVQWTEDAIKDLQKLDRPIRIRLLQKVSWFGRHFEHLTPEPLSADFSDCFKIRVGDWRVIYSLEKNSILIRAIGHRKEIYQY